MKQVVLALLVLLLVAGPAAAAKKASALDNEDKKLSYAMGYDLGTYFKSLGENFDLSVLQQGLDDAYNGRKALMTPEEVSAVQQRFASRQQQKQIRKTVAMVQKNHKAEEEFLKANKKKKGVIETKSGLQYKVIKQGKGPKPGRNDTVKVQYKGTLLNGKEFDSSYKRNQPAVFKVGQVIPGWQEALQLMPAGSTYELYIPAKLAYGDRGAPPVIEPGSMLIFQVELLDVIKDGGSKEKKK
ncbi:MAG TPA: FKBP-type peptidyl-prolyl cis-trans isomerase [Desulfobulbus sp.]|nr:FKBP-type peptidyl-prolyl cis-trans isomerase [Desulfobulbus sp.]